MGRNRAFQSLSHTGTDYTVKRGVPVLAPLDGIVTFSKFQIEQQTNERLCSREGPCVNVMEDGNLIVIAHENVDPAGIDASTLCAHLDEIFVSEGEIVKRGQIIATVGNTGTLCATNCPFHLHFQIFRGKKVLGDNFDPYPDYWFGGKGKPLAFDPNRDYSAVDGQPVAMMTHPIAFGPFLQEALSTAEQKCIGGPEQKCVSEGWQKAPARGLSASVDQATYLDYGGLSFGDGVPSAPLTLFEPIAVAIHLEDVDVVRQPVEEGTGEALGGEHAALLRGADRAPVARFLRRPQGQR